MKYQELGYKSYDDYVRGKGGTDWQEIKDFFFKYCGAYRCGVCGGHWRLLLHKRSYEHLSMKSLREKYIFKLLIIWYLKKYMCWLCFPCNGEIHFKNGAKLPLDYDVLLWREREVKRAYFYNKIYKRIGSLRPSDFLNFVFRIQVY